MLFSNFHININPCNNWSIAPIIQISNTEIKPVNPSETKRLESQATLKGSVGGVQALNTAISFIRLTDVESAIVIISEIFDLVLN
jgi:hypothetical protein